MPKLANIYNSLIRELNILQRLAESTTSTKDGSNFITKNVMIINKIYNAINSINDYVRKGIVTEEDQESIDKLNKIIRENLYKLDSGMPERMQIIKLMRKQFDMYLLRCISPYYVTLYNELMLFKGTTLVTSKHRNTINAMIASIDELIVDPSKIAVSNEIISANLSKLHSKKLERKEIIRRLTIIFKKYLDSLTPSPKLLTSGEVIQKFLTEARLFKKKP